MRDLIRKVLNPVVAMCIEDRESMMALEQKEAENQKRLNLLDGAVFKENGEIGPTIFDEYDSRLSKIDFYVKNQTLKLEH